MLFSPLYSLLLFAGAVENVINGAASIAVELKIDRHMIVYWLSVFLKSVVDILMAYKNHCIIVIVR